MYTKKKGGKVSPAGDQRFKEIVRDRDILASIIKGVIPEFGDMSREEIYCCLDINKDGHTVRGRNIELVSSSNGPVYMDSVFDVRSPDAGDMSIIVAIEGQGSQMSVNDLHNRQIYYSSRLISNQGQDFPNKEELYRHLRKTTVVWVKLSPNAAERNTIVRDIRCRYPLGDPQQLHPSPLDKTDIIEVNVGPYEEGSRSELLGILGILFSRDMDEREKNHNLREKYHIALRSSILREAGNMGALAEEYELYGNERERIGIEKGRIEGIEKGRIEGIEKGRIEGIEEGGHLKDEKIVNHYVSVVYDMIVNESYTPDHAVDTLRLLPEYCEPVLDRVRKKLSDRE